MMRLLSFVLMLILSFLFPSAEKTAVPTVPTVPYVSEIGDFTIGIPQNYTPLSVETVNEILVSGETRDAARDGSMPADAFALFDGYRWTNKVELICADDTDGTICVVTDETEHSMNYIKKRADMLGKQYAGLFVTYGYPEEDVIPYGIVTIGAHDFFRIDVTAGDAAQETLIIVDDANEHMYFFCFSGCDPETVETVMSTLTFTN